VQGRGRVGRENEREAGRKEEGKKETQEEEEKGK